MATKRYQTTSGGGMTVSAADLIILGDADGETVATWLVELDTTGATYSVTFRGRIRGVDPTTSSAQLPYSDATDETRTEVDGATALTGTTATAVRSFYVRSDGFSVALHFSAFSAGSLVLRATPLKG